MIRFEEVNADNKDLCLSLSVTIENNDYVDTVAYSLHEAELDAGFKPHIIFFDNTAIGFVSVYIHDPSYEVTNFFLDDKYQGKGYGKAAVMKMIEKLYTEHGARIISCPVHIEHRTALDFWSRLGFIRSQVIEGDYIFMRKELF